MVELKDSVDAVSAEVQIAFDRAVVLIAAGIREMDGEYEQNPTHYCSSEILHEGLNILAALMARFSPRALLQQKLGFLCVSTFIRDIASLPVAEWLSDLPEEVIEIVSGGKFYGCGPLVVCEGPFVALTEECYDILATSEGGNVSALEEHQVYDYLVAGTQLQYAAGRAFLVRHPLLNRSEFASLGNRIVVPDVPLGVPGQWGNDDFPWFAQLLALAYEPAPAGSYRCPSCGWTLSRYGRDVSCSAQTCAQRVDLDRLSAEPMIDRGTMRLRRGVMRYIAVPGRLELDCLHLAASLGYEVLLYPEKDTCDVLARSKGGVTVAIDAKTVADPQSLALQVRQDAQIGTLNADLAIYVIPDELQRVHPRYCRLVNGALRDLPGRECLTLRRLTSRLRALRKQGDV